jgi:hypothetical protein
MLRNSAGDFSKASWKRNEVPAWLWKGFPGAVRHQPDRCSFVTTPRCCVFKLAVPVLHVGSAAAAEEFYCGRLGFNSG